MIAPEPAAPDVDHALAGRVTAARPEVDRFVAEVLAANAAATLFGATRAVEVGRYRLRRVLGSGGGGVVFVAHDPELDREVAIKLIVAARAEQRTRALAEAQTLARLAHPNVVTVYDVGVIDDRVYLAMELVAGRSLRALARDATPREMLRAYRQAGDGLVAAHARGVVHGDFKPDNAMVGVDGRVRVVDFGLAGAVGADVAGGTPRYMAPELRDGAAAAPTIDQYAFAVALRESLGDAGWATLPRWLAPILDRATAAEPAARHRDLAALLAALANDPRTRWRRRGLVAAPIVLAAAGFALGRGDGGPAPGPRCDDAAAALAPAWTDARGARLATSLRDLGTPFATQTADTAPAALGRYAATWGDAHVAACRDRGRELPALSDRRATCLARARARLDATAELLETATADAVADAVRAVSELPPLARCTAAEVALDEVAPPPAAQADAARAVTDALDRAAARVAAARPDAVAATAAVVTDARALGYPPLVAAALLWHGRALAEQDRESEARAPLTEAVELALSARADAIAVEAYARLLLTGDSDDYAEAIGGLRPIAALATRLDARDRAATALLHNHAGVIEQAAGHVDAARAAWTRALALAREVEGPGAVELAWVRANLAMVTADPAAQAALRAEALTVVRDHLGPDHPLALALEMASAFAAPSSDAARHALRGPCTRAATLHPGRGEVVVVCAYELGVLDLSSGDRVAAAASFALATSQTLGGELDDQRRALAAAFQHLLAGDRARADRELAALAAAWAPTATTPWYALVVVADAELGRALAGAPGATARAVALLDRAAASAGDAPPVQRRLAWARALPR